MTIHGEREGAEFPEQEDSRRDMTGSELYDAYNISDVSPATQKVVEYLTRGLDGVIERYFEQEEIVENVLQATERVYQFAKERNVHTIVLLDKSTRFDWVILDAFSKADNYPLQFKFIRPDLFCKDYLTEEKLELLRSAYPDLSKIKEPVLVLDEETARGGKSVQKTRQAFTQVFSPEVYAAVLGFYSRHGQDVRPLHAGGYDYFCESGHYDDYMDPRHDVLLGSQKDVRPWTVIRNSRDMFSEGELIMNKEQRYAYLDFKEKFGLDLHGQMTGGVREGGDNLFVERGAWWARYLSRRIKERYRDLAEKWWTEHQDEELSDKAAE